MVFTFKILSRQCALDELDDNVDVEVALADGRIYSATFFTLRNIQTLMERYRRSGECAGGVYFWAVDMVLVERLTEETIRLTLQDMIEQLHFHKAFQRIDHQRL